MRLALLGTGRMGRETEAVARERGHEVTAWLGHDANPEGTGITGEALGGARVAIDFTSAASVLPNVRASAAAGINLVVGTTGWSRDLPEVERAVGEAGTGLLHAPNFSIGMLLFMRVVEEAARLVDGVGGYDVHMWEAHHRHKADHPGGTARGLADLLVERLGSKGRWDAGLPPEGAVDRDLLQVSVVRAGEIPGTHGVALEGLDDRIELKHEARSRRGFARGAVLAAEWLEGRKGVFTLDDLLLDKPRVEGAEGHPTQAHSDSIATETRGPS